MTRVNLFVAESWRQIYALLTIKAFVATAIVRVGLLHHRLRLVMSSVSDDQDTFDQQEARHIPNSQPLVRSSS